MMKKAKMLLCLLFLGLSLAGNAQTATIPNVLNFKSTKSSGEIFENEKLVGYYVFYFKEKADKKNSIYEIEILDDNFNSMKSFEITRPKKTYLVESVFNGEVFMFFFYDVKTGFEFTTFDRTGEKQGSSTVPVKEISKYEVQRISASIGSNSENFSVYPLGSNGFVRQTFAKNKKLGYEIIGYDNSAKEIWKYSSAETSSQVETADINEASEKNISLTITRKKNLMTKQTNEAFVLLNAEDGTVKCEVELGNETSGKLALLKTYNDETNETVLLIGEYYKPGDDMLKDKSQGLFLKEINGNGTENKFKKFAWKGDIDKFKQKNLDEEDKKDADKPFYIFFHDVVRGSNGHLFMIGEQFKKQVSAAGVAANVLNGGGNSGVANFEIRVANMVVIEFDEKDEMVDFDLIHKKKTSVLLPSGAGYYNSAFLGYYVKSIGGFDYSFTSRDKENDRFSVVYIDADRKEEGSKSKADKMLGVINIEGGKKTEERIAINTDAKTFWLMPAKPGYIAIGEYFRKEKKVNLRLEPLSY
jgi:hypothetical protein